MSPFLFGVALILFVAAGAGFVRILRGPTNADRMLAAQLFGTIGIALMLLLSEAMAQPAAQDVAFIFAVLAALAALAFVRHTWRDTDVEDDK